MANDKVKLPRSSYDELCKIIRAYGKLEEKSTLDDVNSLAGVGRSTVSANNSFLASIEIIEGGKSKKITELGSEVAQALEHEINSEIEKAWQEVIQNNDFLNKMALAVKIRRSMEESNFVSHIAYSAGESKSGYVMTGARAVIDILKASGLVVEKDGELVYQNSEEVVEPENEAIPEIKKSKIQETQDVQKVVQTSHGNVNLNIDIQIQVEFDQLDELGPKLKAIINSLDDENDEEKNESED